MTRAALILCLVVLAGCKPENTSNQAAVTDITDNNGFHYDTDPSGQACGLTVRDMAAGHGCVVVEKP
jgi:hypothetical protein